MEEAAVVEKVDPTDVVAPVPWRITTACLLFLLGLSAYTTRFAIVVAILHMSVEFNYSHETEGLILSAFFIGNIFTQIVSGSMLSSNSKVGTHKCLGVAWVMWSLITCAVPLCAAHSVQLVVVALICLGAAQGPVIPGHIAVIANWFPVHERARAAMSANTGMALGMAGVMASAPLAAHSWQMQFYVFGLISFVSSIAFLLLSANKPSTHWAIRPAEDDANLEDAAFSGAAQEVGTYGVSRIPPHSSDEQKISEEQAYLQILTTPAFWAIAAAHMAYNWGLYVVPSWLPLYFALHFEVPKAEVGKYAMWPYLASAGASLVVGTVVDSLIQSGWSLRSARVWPIAVSAIVSSLVWLPFIFSGSLIPHIGASVLLVVWGLAQPLQTSCFYPNMADIGGVAASGQIAAVSNTFAQLPGIIGNMLVGAILDRFEDAGWPLVFGTLLLVQIIGCAIFVSLMRVTLINFQPSVKA